MSNFLNIGILFESNSDQNVKKIKTCGVPNQIEEFKPGPIIIRTRIITVKFVNGFNE